ncbi:MAG: DNA repair protein RecN [Coriobacteriia bacterium]|nr:DNA repair protein RecN [Coriobacteriia bacterium]
MLTELRVRNIALIARADLELGPGLTVLSGETGAGKTALLSSLKLLIGERGDSGMVGAEGDEARVEALFAFGDSTEECLAVRRITAEGRSRCYLDDTLVTVGKLGESLGPLVDLYGQHEHQSLLKAAEQLRILDEFGGESSAVALGNYQESLESYQDAYVQLEKLQELSSSSSAEREQAAFVVREIEKLAPEEGEYELLEQELPRLTHGEQLAEATREVMEMLRGEQGVLERLSAADKTLEKLVDIDTLLYEPRGQLSSYLVGLEELAGDLGRYASGIEHDPEALQRALERLGALDGLSRRFGPGMDQVFAHLERSRELLLGSEDSAMRIQEATEKLAKAQSALVTCADELSLARATGAQQFIGLLNESIAHLALAGASLEFSIQDLPFEKWNQRGSQNYELLYRPAPEASARPLAKIASGGELSRVMLAIKGLLQASEQGMILVFDEIDAGIGGKTAHAVAERLARLAQVHQVIVITHLAQIAVVADAHFVVEKSSVEKHIRTTITQLDQDERIKEVARMLSGSSDEEALAHAKKMLEEARQ